MARNSKRSRAWKYQDIIVQKYVETDMAIGKLSIWLYQTHEIYTTQNTLIKILKENGVYKPKKFVPPHLNSYAVRNEDKIVEDYKSGMKLKDIKDRYRCSYRTIYDALRKYGVKLIGRPTRVSRFDKYIDDIKRDYYEGWLSIRALACKYGTTYQNIAHFMRKNGVKMRDRKGTTQAEYSKRRNYGKGKYDYYEWHVAAKEELKKTG